MKQDKLQGRHPVLGVHEYGHMAIACPDRRSAEEKAT